MLSRRNMFSQRDVFSIDFKQLNNDSVVRVSTAYIILEELAKLLKADYFAFQEFVEVCQLEFHKNAIDAAISELPLDSQKKMAEITSLDIHNVIVSSVDQSMVINDPFCNASLLTTPRVY
jgi:hypothetical protein